MYRLLVALLCAALVSSCATRRETVVLGVRTAASALSYQSESGKYVGFHVDLCERIVRSYEKDMGRPVDIEYRAVTSESRLRAVETGFVDLECGSTSKNPARQQIVDFLPTTYVTESRIAVLTGSPARTLAELAGKRIGFLRGTTVERALPAAIGREGLSVQLVPVELGQVAGRMRSGELDAVAIETELLASWGSQEAGLQGMSFRVLGPAITTEPIGIMISKKPTRLREVAFQTVEALLRSGQIAGIYSSWFEGEIPAPLGRLGVPANEATRSAWAQAAIRKP